MLQFFHPFALRTATENETLKFSIFTAFAVSLPDNGASMVFDTINYKVKIEYNLLDAYCPRFRATGITPGALGFGDYWCNNWGSDLVIEEPKQ